MTTTIPDNSAEGIQLQMGEALREYLFTCMKHFVVANDNKEPDAVGLNARQLELMQNYVDNIQQDPWSVKEKGFMGMQYYESNSLELRNTEHDITLCF